MSEKLRFFDPQLKEKPEQELFNEPEWLMELRQLDGQIRVRRERERSIWRFFNMLFFFLKLPFHLANLEVIICFNLLMCSILLLLDWGHSVQ